MSCVSKLTSLHKKVNKMLFRAKPFLRHLKPNFRTWVLIYVFAMLLLMKTKINGFIRESFASFMTESYTFLSSNRLGNLLTTTILVVCGIYLIARLLKKKNFSWVVLLFSFLIIYLLFDDEWVWAQTVFPFNYKWLILAILIISLVCSIVMSFRMLIHSPSIDIDSYTDSGFSTITQRDNLQDTGWGSYVENLVAKVLKTDLSQESFAVGVSGPWGSGKTTFLAEIERELKGKVYLMRFNPWNSASPAQISNDFFKTIVSSLSISWNQRRSIARYARILSKVNMFHPRVNSIATLFEDADVSIEDAKDKAEDVIRLMPLPVVILIDDLDRLEGLDILAVLRLICVTANFRNLVFVVAYDKTYVLNVLSQARVSNGGEYLKKIFPLEVCLPAFESFVLANQLYNELNNSLSDKSLVSQLDFAVFRGLPKHKVSFYLPTFRDVKRFVNQFSLNVNSFIRAKQLSEIDIYDLFHLELLQYYDFNAYQSIQYDPESLLRLGYNNQKKNAFSFSSPGSIKGVKAIEEKDALVRRMLNDFREGVDDLLWAVFGRIRDNEENLARYPTNFTKYFSYRINKDVISLSEFDQMMNSETPEEVRERIRQYCRGGVSKKKSLSYHLTSCTIDETNETQAFNVAYAIIELALYRGINAGAVLKTAFEKKRFSETSAVSNALTRAIKEHIGAKNSWNLIQDILTSLVGCEYDNPASPEESDVIYESVLSWDGLQALSEDNFISALNERSMKIQNITDKNALFHRFLTRAVAQIGILSYDGEHEERIYRSLLVEKLTKLYSLQDNGEGLDEFFNNLDPRKDDIYVYDYQPEDYLSYVLDNISSVFGSVNANKDFYSFILGAFAGHEQRINDYLKRFQLKEIEGGIEKKERRPSLES